MLFIFLFNPKIKGFETLLSKFSQRIIDSVNRYAYNQHRKKWRVEE
jgi:hypothetical protein